MYGIIASYLTVEAFAAHTILANLLNLIQGVQKSYGSATQVFVGHNVGSCNFGLSMKYFKVMMAITGLICLCLSTVFVLCSKQVIALFTVDPERVELVQSCWLLLQLVIYVTFVQKITTACIRGYGLQRVGLVLVFISIFVISLPVTLMLVHLNYGLIGVWIGYTLGFGLVSLS